MKKYLLNSLILLFGMSLFAACIKKEDALKPVSKTDTLTVNHSMKGWELYSWPAGNSWKFAFLLGTNRIKSLEEVTTQTSNSVLIRVMGVDSVKLVLNRFPHGESIIMIGQGWLQNVWGAQAHGNLQLPSQSVINDLKSYSMQKHVTLNVTD